MPPPRLHRRTTVEATTDGAEPMERRRWLLLGPSGAVQFLAFWYPPGSALHSILTRDSPAAPYVRDGEGALWMGADVGYHSPRPIYDDHDPAGPCDVLEGPCFSDGSALRAGALLHEWAAADWDDEVLWATLTHEYAVLFHPDAEALRDALDRLDGDPAAVDDAVAALVRRSSDA